MREGSDYTRLEVPRGSAPRALRALAASLDAVVVAIPVVIGGLIVRSLSDDNGGGEADRVVFGFFAGLAAVGLYVWNFGFRQGRAGASVGQSWCGLIVRSAAGGPLGVRRGLLLVPGETVRRITAEDEGFVPIRPVCTVRAVRVRRVTWLLALAVMLAVAFLASIAVGARPLTLLEIWNAVTPPYGDRTSDTDIIVQSLRLPRAVLGLVVGIALGITGALIQGHTRNPLADPAILGITGGASAAVVSAIFLLGVHSTLGYVWFALIGAFLAILAVFGLSTVSGGKMSPLSLLLGGAAVTAFLSSVTNAIILMDETTLSSFRFWIVGSVASRGLDVTLAVLPFLVVGTLLAIASAPSMNLLNLGEDMARALGTNVAVTRGVGIVAIALLAGGATAACGPIAFLALVVPHVARHLAGADYRWILPLSGLIGANLLLICDVIGRVVVRPDELEVGIVLALVGGPFFIALIRRRKLASL